MSETSGEVRRHISLGAFLKDPCTPTQDKLVTSRQTSNEKIREATENFFRRAEIIEPSWVAAG